VWPSALITTRPSAPFLQVEQLARLDERFKGVLAGHYQPESAAERITFAQHGKKYHKLNAAAARSYAAVFAEQPALAVNPQDSRRYSAACSAALAGCRQGKDAADLGEEACANFRRQALEWLRADLAAWGRLLEKEPEKTRPLIAGRMQQWLADNDLAGVRGEALAKLPEAERPAWQKLWTDVANTLAAAEEKTAAGKIQDRK
jgi:hypothetical protein